MKKTVCRKKTVYRKYVRTKQYVGKKQYVGSGITRFCTRFNNYRSCHRKFCRGHSVIQVLFHAHFILDEHCGIADWEIILIERECNKQETRKKRAFLGI